MKEEVYFLNIELENIRSFKESTTLDLSDGKGNWKRWTVILGDNGTGKTTLLQCLSLLEFKKTNINSNNLTLSGDTLNSGNRSHVFSGYNLSQIYNFNYNYLDQPIEEESISSIRSNLFYKNKNYLPFTGEDFNNKYDHFIEIYKVLNSVFSVDTKGLYYQRIKQDFIVFAYGANRKINSSNLTDKWSTLNNATLFYNDAELINAEEWLLQLDYAASKDSDIKEYAIKKREQVIQILTEMLPDIDEIKFSYPTKEKLIPTVEFKTPFGLVTLDQLSLGYKTMVAWMVDLAARMYARYPDSPNPVSEPAIVLIDEIDLHLHPKWQRKIFDYLADIFPKTQFIVTAHSPLVVQSAPLDANIVLLRKVGDKVVIDNDLDIVQKWRLDQIMSSDIFGIDSTRGTEVEKLLNERKNLLQKGNLSNDEELRLQYLHKIAHSLPVANNESDIEAMEIIRKAADYIKNKNSNSSND